MVAGLTGCGGEEGDAAPAAVDAAAILLVDRAAASGLTFVHRSGATGTFKYPEIMSGGVCLADLDGDGDLDAYFAQGGPLPGDPGEPGRNALFLNDGAGHFHDASAGSGADHAGYGMGAFAADVDEDGDQDLLLTNAGPLALLRNRGDGTFEDITAFAGLGNRSGFWLNASFGDFDGDGHLDVYVSNYTDWKPGVDPDCYAPGGSRDYCNPVSYPGERDLLALGQGDGRFVDATQASGVGAVATRSMGVVALDVDDDGDLDLYVANDGEANLMWINQGDGTFRDEALIRGVALDGAGEAQASMGIACADPDGDGDEDLLLTHLEQETHTFYQNDGGFFTDATSARGFAHWSRPDTGFGVGLVDLDHDEWLDLFVATGGVAQPSRPLLPDQPYAQPDRTARGEPGGLYPVAMPVGGDSAARLEDTAVVSRGAAFGDVDGDGRLDVVVLVRDGAVRLLRNETKTEGRWIGFSLVAPAASALLARVRLEELPERGVGTLRPHASYLGSHENTVRFGLGARRAPVSAVVRWATGEEERFADCALNRVHALRRGAGGPVTAVAAGPRTVDSSAGAVAHRTDAPTAGDAEAAAAAVGGDAGPFPGLRFEKEGARGRRVVLDGEALSAWCARAGLPPPPAPGDLDAPTWELVHPAIEAAGRSPAAENLGALAMYYDGHGARESARTLYTRLVQLVPGEARWWHLLGRVAFELGDPEGSVAAFTKAVALAPDEPAGFARLAEAQLTAEQAAAATLTWQRYLTMRSEDAYGMTGLARAEERCGRMDEALARAESALARNPRARPALVLAARVAGRLGKLDRARGYGERAAALTEDDDPGLVDNVDLAMRAHARSVAYLREAANHYKSVGRFAEAVQATRWLAERRPDEAQNYQMLTWLSVMLGQGDEALEYAKVALEIDPRFPPGWDLVARGRFAEGQSGFALDAVDRALAYDPSFTGAHLTRGIVLGDLGRFTEALAALDRGLAANPDDVNGLAMKAHCLMNTDRRSEARVIVDRILTLVPDHPWALEARKEL